MRVTEPRLIEALVLGLVQGPAELLPISSSAHVGLLLRWRRAALPGEVRKEIEVALHAGTALASGRPRAPIGLLAAATVPPALAGLALERPIEARLGTPRSVALALLVGSAAMVVADRVPQRRTAPSATALDGAALGVAQAAALVPGISRSGATRAAARARGFTRADAGLLSREVAVPVLAGATALKGLRLARRRPSRGTLRALAAGALAAALSTRAALWIERSRAADAPLAAWAAYRTALAAAILLACQDRAR